MLKGVTWETYKEFGDWYYGNRFPGCRLDWTGSGSYPMVGFGVIFDVHILLAQRQSRK